VSPVSPVSPVSFAPIAIVGRACVLPGALNPEALWEAVAAQRDLLASAPAGRWGLDPGDVLVGADADAADGCWSDRGGYVRGFEDVWNAEGFGLPAQELQGLDRGVRWLLHCAREALRGVQGWNPARTDAILGNLSFPSESLSRYAQSVWFDDLTDAERAAAGIETTDPRNRFHSSLPAWVLRQSLGLGGQTYCLDAACASSLYAIKLACDRLQDGASDVALAGASNAADDLFLHMGFCALSALSKTGQSRPFHAGADGLVPAEGAGIVVLKRLADAERDGDTIHGVIRGVGLSNDGRGRGMLAPSAIGQQRAIETAWAGSGLSPAAAGLLECHATGTPVGDGTEINSSAAAFAGHLDLPLGSLKGNLGHLITAAGVAGLIKVLEAFRHGTRPPSRPVDDLNPALDGTPLRLLAAAEPWPSSGPRVAAVSAFGFGGNNAHLVVQEYAPGIEAPAPPPPAPIAVVGLAARVGETTTADLPAVWAAGAPVSGCAGSVDVDLAGLKFPPRDLQQSLGQQTMVFGLAREAVLGLELSPERTAVLIGMEADAEVARYGARWRLAGWSRSWGQTPNWLHDARNGVVPVLESPGVLGTMPNIPANRLNSQLDLGGPSFTLSAGGASGLVGLQLAARALSAGEIDAAVVGAVDLSCEPVHERAAGAVLPPSAPADGAAVFVLRRLADAEAEGLPVLAVLQGQGEAVGAAPGARDPAAVLGRPFAAAGALAVAVALAESSPSESRTAIHAGPSGPESIGLTRGPAPWPAPAPVARPLSMPAHRAPPGLPPRSAPAAPEVQMMKPAPTLAPVLFEPPSPQAPATATPPAPESMSAPARAAAPAMAAPAWAAPPSPAAAPIPAGGVLDQYRAHLAQLGAIHQQHLAAQAALHDRFLTMRTGAQQLLLSAGAQGIAPVPASPPAFAPPAGVGQPTSPAPTSVRPTFASPAPVSPPAPPAVAPAVPAARPTTEAASRSAAPPARLAVREPEGLTLTREQLEVHATGRISEIFGPVFRQQAAYPRQVRMPEPPLLLADRVVGLDAEPGTMGLGTIWTETDVAWDSWYLHQGRMPAGVMIEAGQADLMLISWLGVDFANKGERVYRLLGCELTYHNDLPKPGETMRYEIHVDGHANQGDVRLFFFHYDCRVDGELRLSVRGGQAGFFTDEELAESAGCLWTPEEQEIVANPRLADPLGPVPTSYSRDDLEAFAAGRPWDCFGDTLWLTKTHNRTPTIGGDRMLFLDSVTDLDPTGGPWGRGYLRGEWPVSPEDWFFEGHFKNDACMPGTLMFEGCLQAMAFYLSAMGVTAPRDGWRFQPVSDEPFALRCRGQVTRSSQDLVYEIFVEEFVDGPIPTLYADLLCTVDGLKAFHARRVGLQLVPAWPLEAWPQLLDGYDDPEPVAAQKDFRFDYASLMACAWGRPSDAFGAMYDRFDGPTRVARLPGPPYHFMSRVTHVDGDIGNFEAGAVIELEYDVPPDAWYFAENGCATMPFAVLLEAALQPCGWLACFVGSALTTDQELSFRNLDGTATLTQELFADVGTLRTRVKMLSISRVAGMIIQGFEVVCFVGDRPVYTMDTVFGFFPGAALQNQVGLPTTDDQRGLLTQTHALTVDLTERPERYCAGSLRLPEPMLLMVDRLEFTPDSGEAGLGRLRGAKDVDPGEWFFKAHFFQDPVQPGSLGLEALVQLLQWFCIHEGMTEGLESPRFEPIELGRELAWKYRGQVVPANSLIHSTMDVTERGVDDDGHPYVVGRGSLWVDGKRIYEAENMGMRVVGSVPPTPTGRDGGRTGRPTGLPAPTVSPRESDDRHSARTRWHLDPAADSWLADHRPTWTLPAVPMMAVADLFAQSVDGELAALHDVQMLGWLVIDRPTDLRVDRAGDRLTLFARPDKGDWKPVAMARVGEAVAVEALTPLTGEAQPDPYASGALFHGPGLHLLTDLVWGEGGASGTLRCDSSLLRGRWNPGLLDGLTHVLPHDALHAWDPSVDASLVHYPTRLKHLSVFGPIPRTGTVRVEARQLDGPCFHLQAQAGDRVLIDAVLVETGFPKGPLGEAEPADRRAFLQGAWRPGIALSRDGAVDADALAQTDFLPGTVEAVYGTCDRADIARRDAVAAEFAVHPRHVDDAFPLGRDALDPEPSRAFWRTWFGVGPWPADDLCFALAQRFVSRVVLEDPAAVLALRGRGALFLANHQTAIESLLFSVLVGGLLHTPTATLAKAEHRDSWLGQLIGHLFSWPGVRDPEVIRFFDRDDPRALSAPLAALAQDLGAGRSALVHVDGTRAGNARQTVQQVGSAMIDLAIETGTPIVPVRFVGGVPVDGDLKRDWPVGFGSQAIRLGRPLLPEELAAVPLVTRKQRVLDALHGVWPPAADEVPTAGDDAFAATIEASVKTEHQAVLAACLAEAPNPSPGTRRLLAALSGEALSGDDAETVWLRGLAAFLID